MTCRCLRKRPDTVGELKSAAICVSHMPSLKAKKPRKIPQEKVLLELCSGFANSIRPLNETRGKELVLRRKPPSGVSFSHLSKHRLINALAAEINETDILVKTHRRAYR